MVCKWYLNNGFFFLRKKCIKSNWLMHLWRLTRQIGHLWGRPPRRAGWNHQAGAETASSRGISSPSGKPVSHLKPDWEECKLTQPLWRTVWKFLKKTKNDTTIWPRNPTTENMPWANHHSKRHRYPSVHCSTIYKLQTT